MKKELLVGALLAIGVIIYNARKKDKKSTSSEQIFIL